MQSCGIEIWSCITGTISAFGMGFISFYIYKMTSIENKRDSYFRQIIELYYMIEDDSKQLILRTDKSDVLSKEESDYQREHYKRRITINCNVMQYYLIRIPGHYQDRLKFWELLYSISQHPDRIDNYSKLSERYQDFLSNYRGSKSTITSMSSDYDGRPLEK